MPRARRCADARGASLIAALDSSQHRHVESLVHLAQIMFRVVVRAKFPVAAIEVLRESNLVRSAAHAYLHGVNMA